MTEMLPLFGDEPPLNKPVGKLEPAMTDHQRQGIREHFESLGIRDAKSQFDLVHELTGHPIRSVRDLNMDTANTLLRLLGARAAIARNPSTGNAWADRTEDSWIDNL